MPSAHAVRSASGAKRWINCAGSIRMEHGRPNNSSAAARQGTAAHALGETCLLDGSDAHDWLGGFVRLDQREQATVYRPPLHDGSDTDGDKTAVVPVHASAEGLPPEGHEDWPIDADMADAVQVYLDAVRLEMELLGPHAEMQVERSFDLNWLVGFDFDFLQEEADLDDGLVYVSPSGIRRGGDGLLYHADGRVSWGPMFGTNDVSVFLPFQSLVVFDYKHGQGVVVEVPENDQELYYALGKAREVDWAFEELTLVIVQPRARHAEGGVRRWTTTAARLREFEATLREAAHRTEDPDAPLAAGEWCTFCRAAAVCPELREESFRQAGLDFGEPGDEPTFARSGPETSDEDLAMRVAAIKLLDAFAKSVKAEVLRRLLETETGEAPYGKLVQKRSNRTFLPSVSVEDPGTGETVEVPVLEYLESRGIPRADMLLPPKMLSVAQLEKVRPAELMARLKAEKVRAPAAWIKSLVEEVSTKLPGGITMAGPDDPRPAVPPGSGALEDFDAASEFGEASLDG